MGRVCFERNKYVAVENNGSYTIFSTRHCIIVSVVCCCFFFTTRKFYQLVPLKFKKPNWDLCGKDFRAALTQRRDKKRLL